MRGQEALQTGKKYVGLKCLLDIFFFAERVKKIG